MYSGNLTLQIYQPKPDEVVPEIPIPEKALKLKILPGLRHIQEENVYNRIGRLKGLHGRRRRKDGRKSLVRRC